MKKIVGILIVAALAFGGWTAWKKWGGGGADAELAFHGNVDIREVNLGFRVAGRIARVLKEEGDSVKEGEPLAELDGAPLKVALAQAEANLATTQAKLLELKNGSRREEIDQATATLRADEASLENARQTLERQRQLVKTRALADQDLDNAEAAFRTAKARVEASSATLQLVQAGPRKELLAQAEANVAAAQAGVESARIQLEDTRILAPRDAIVLTRVLEPGSIVQPGATVLTLNLVKPVRVRAYAAEAEMDKIQPGRAMLVYTDSRPEPYHGQIGEISPRAEFTPKTVETRKLRSSLVYRYRVIVSDADDGLRQGMPVTVKFAPR